MLKLQYLANKVDQIQDNIASAKNNVIHPSIFTAEEIKLYEIDFYKLKLVKVGILKYKNQSLIIAVKVPKNYIKTDLKLITPLANKDYREIDEDNEHIVTIGNKTFSYIKNSMLKDLKVSKNCILKNQCKFKYNNRTKIESLDDETLLIKNAVQEKLKQNCDERNITLNKNNLINFYNCEIELYQETFHNQKQIIQDRFFYPNSMYNHTKVEMISFDNIVNNQFENIKEIEELKWHKHISYGINATFTILVILAIIILIFWLRKRNMSVTIVN